MNTVANEGKWWRLANNSSASDGKGCAAALMDPVREISQLDDSEKQLF